MQLRLVQGIFKCKWELFLFNDIRRMSLHWKLVQSNIEDTNMAYLFTDVLILFYNLDEYVVKAINNSF